MKRHFEDFDSSVRLPKIGRHNDTSRKVIAVRITQLYRPDSNPLGGLMVDDVYNAFSSIGTIDKIVCASSPKTGPPLTHVDAMVQFQSHDAAAHAIEHWNGSSLTSNEFNSMSIQYSCHAELHVQNNNRCRDYTKGNQANADALLGAVAGVLNSSGPGSGIGLGLDGEDDWQWQPGGTGLAVGNSGQSGKRVILARMTNLKNPELNPLGGLKVDIVHNVFCMCGTIEKIVCSSTPKTGPPLVHVDAMVQYSTPDEAAACIESFNGLSLTGDGYYFMELMYSKLDELKVRANNDRSWDFTSVGMPTNSRFSEPSSDQAVAALAAACGGVDLTSMVASLTDEGAADTSSIQGMPEQRVIVAHVTDLYHPEQNPLGGLTVATFHAAFSVCGVIEKIVCASSPKTGPPLKHVDAMVQYASPKSALIAITLFNRKSLTGDNYNIMRLEYSRNQELVVKVNNNRAHDYTSEGSLSEAANLLAAANFAITPHETAYANGGFNGGLDPKAPAFPQLNSLDASLAAAVASALEPNLT